MTILRRIFAKLFELLKVGVVSVFAPVWNHVGVLKLLSNLLFFLASIVTMGWVLFWLGQKPAFSLSHLTIESATGKDLKHVNVPTIRSRALDQINGNFFTIRLDQTRQLFESMPWVRKASVRREWPNGIVIAIEEHEALGVWGSSDNPRLMNTHGEVFIANMAEAEDGKSLLKFAGPEGSSLEVFRKMQKMNEWFEAWNAHVVSLELSSRYAWRAKLNNGLTLDLGRELDERDGRQIDMSVERLLKTWPQVDDKWRSRIDAIDLRYANGYAIHIGKK